ncbi:oxidized purine nucleoside triphosphate hydrolase-like [Glandiceps talaboti]
MAANISKKIFTLVFVREQSRLLLGLKKRGFGKGKWNGFGGKLQANETIDQAAVRELEEECGIVANRLDKVALIDFEFQNDPVIFEVHVYKTDSYHGKITESEEMLPQWFDLDAIP